MHMPHTMVYLVLSSLINLILTSWFHSLCALLPESFTPLLRSVLGIGSKSGTMVKGGGCLHKGKSVKEGEREGRKRERETSRLLLPSHSSRLTHAALRNLFGPLCRRNPALWCSFVYLVPERTHIWINDWCMNTFIYSDPFAYYDCSPSSSLILMHLLSS